MKVEFYYVRHGKTLFNTLGRMQGACDSPLTEEGIEQAKETASALRSVHFDRIYCSASERAWDTAKIIAAGRNMEPVLMNELKEFNFGELDGTLFSEMDDRIQPHRMADDWTDVGGENVELFDRRSRPGFERIIRESKDGDRILIVSHGSYFMHLMKTILQYDQQDYIARRRAADLPFIQNCSISRFIYEDGTYSLVQEPLTAEEFRRPKTVRFYYVRHGETIFNTRELMQGWCDSPLTENGVSQAKEAAELLKEIHFDKAYCSSSGRTRDTAEILLGNRELKAVPDKRLREVYFGSFEAANYREKWDEMIPHFMAEDWTSYDGENHAMVEKRLRSFLRDAVDAAEDGDHILMVSHGDFYVSMLVSLFGIDKWGFYQEGEEKGYNPVPNCGIAVIEYSPEGWKLLKAMHENKMLQ
ncbi:MAG: histidine phosphatase family protein [Solobacterium sp.]|nr:histidine phosphatase family protein [Solobacterium sp.]